jgi:starch synthase
VSSLPEIVADGETGFLVAAERADAFADAVNRTLDDRDLARRLGDAGLRRARAEFSVAKMADATVAVYEKAVWTTASAHDSTE